MTDEEESFYEFTEPVPPPAIDCDTDPVGVIEIAARLGVRDRSVHKMKQRGVLPRPDHESVNGSRAWEWRNILWWAGETKRLAREILREEYRAVFGIDPPIATPPGPPQHRRASRPASRPRPRPLDEPRRR